MYAVNSPQCRALWKTGVFGFKCFLVPSGVDEFPHVGESDLRVALPELVKLGAPLLAHAELPRPIERAAAAAAENPPTQYATWLASRPRDAQEDAITLLSR